MVLKYQPIILSEARDNKQPTKVEEKLATEKMRQENSNVSKPSKESQVGKSKKQKWITIVAILFVLGLIGSLFDKKSNISACDCADILNIPTKKVGYDTYPLVDQNNEDYAKWTECKEEYSGYATATLECMENYESELEKNYQESLK